jgi:hypothetical protein
MVRFVLQLLAPVLQHRGLVVSRGCPVSPLWPVTDGGVSSPSANEPDSRTPRINNRTDPSKCKVTDNHAAVPYNQW